jgi:outer membrane protein TolC
MHLRNLTDVVPAAAMAADCAVGPQSPADLLTRRPDLIAAERRLAASNARIGEAMAEYYPKVSLSGMLGSATTIASGNLLTAGVFGLRWRLFDFGRIDAQIQLARGRDAEALAGYRQAVLRVTEDVENAFSALANRAGQAERLSQAVDALSQARTSSFAAYQRGTANLIDVLQADESVLQAVDARAQAQADTARAAVAAFRALGGGWQPASDAAVAGGATNAVQSPPSGRPTRCCRELQCTACINSSKPCNSHRNGAIRDFAEGCRRSPAWRSN